MQNFEGRVAVITGGASGIGLAMAKRFIAEGMRVAIGDVEKTALDDSVDLLRSLVPKNVDGSESTERRVFGFALDVSDGAQMQAFADATIDHFGAVNIFCNNAGVGGGGLSWVPRSSRVGGWGFHSALKDLLPGHPLYSR